MEEVLRAKYLASFSDKVKQLEQALADDNRQVLMQKVHQLAGSSGSYGFPELADCCANVEEQLMSGDQSEEEIVTLLTPLIDLLNKLKP